MIDTTSYGISEMYADFIKRSLEKLEEVILEQHKLLMRIYELNQLLDDNYNVMVTYGLNPSMDAIIESNNFKVPIKLEQVLFQDFEIVEAYIEYVSSIKTMFKLKVLADRYGLQSRLTYSIYRSMHRQLHLEASAQILKGQTYTLPNLGFIKILMVPMGKWDNIDWVRSRQFKEELIKAGYKPYDAKTGTGKYWYLPFETKPDFIPQIVWSKNKCTNPNKIYYKFRGSRGANPHIIHKLNVTSQDMLSYYHAALHARSIWLWLNDYDFCLNNYQIFEPKTKEQVL